MQEFASRSLSFRQEASSYILERHTDRVPILVDFQSEKYNLDKFKYLVPKFILLGQFVNIIRKRISNLDASEALFIFVGDEIPMLDTTVIQLYNTFKNADDFLYITIRCEAAFGYSSIFTNIKINQK